MISLNNQMIDNCIVLLKGTLCLDQGWRDNMLNIRYIFLKPGSCANRCFLCPFKECPAAQPHNDGCSNVQVFQLKILLQPAFVVLCSLSWSIMSSGMMDAQPYCTCLAICFSILAAHGLVFHHSTVSFIT